MLFIPKTGISQRALNRIKRLASFKNPMFFRQQAMRLSTYGHPRVISCADETKEYLCLPRECQEDLSNELEEIGIKYRIIDRTYSGKNIDVTFKGRLRDEQSLALESLLQHETGILSGTTAFGKTVVAIRLIAERKVNTLILVDKISLLSQWKKKISDFLTINEALPEPAGVAAKKRGRKRKIGLVGQHEAGKNTLGGIVDIAVTQSLSRKGEVKECIQDYGMIIADECHHVSAFTYESILKAARAKCIYGLIATPTRKDGHHPIFFMHCGPIRYRDNPKKQAEKRPFGHFIGEGFDEPRLDTLFLTMPISWKGTLQQYAGRLHRLHENKREVRIYDYVDIQVNMLERMYQRRLNGYASMGYKAKGEDISSMEIDIIYNRDSFLPVFINDIATAKKEILIVSPYVRRRRTIQMIQKLQSAIMSVWLS